MTHPARREPPTLDVRVMPADVLYSGDRIRSRGTYEIELGDTVRLERVLRALAASSPKLSGLVPSLAGRARPRPAL